MVGQPPVVTSTLLWKAAGVTSLVDLPLVILVAWGVSADRFRTLGRYVALSASVVFAAIWFAFGSLLFWEEVYGRLFPAWSRWLLPAFYGVLFGAFGYLNWRVCTRLTRWPAACFCVFGGLVSLVGHGIGIARGLLRVPMLADASPASALAFGVAEFIVYWAAILGLALCLRTLARRRG